MSKTQKIILGCIVAIVIIAYSGYLLNGYLHEPPAQEELDSLQFIKDQAKRNADLNGDSSKTSYEKYEQSNKNIYAPIDSTEREKLRARITAEAKRDSIRRGSVR